MTMTTEPEWDWDRIFARLRELDDLEDNWDDTGSKPILKETMDNVRRVLEWLWVADYLEPSSILPCPDGSVFIAWQLENDNYLEAEVTPAGTLEWMSRVDGEYTHWEDTI